MIVDLLQQICSFSKIREKICTTQINKCAYNDIFVYSIEKPKSMYDIKPVYTVCEEDPIYSKISQDVLMQHKFSKLKSLYIADKNKNITNLDHLCYTLVELHCYNNHINRLCVAKLHKLHTLFTRNPNIFDFDKLSDTLKNLYSYNLTQSHIQNLSKLEVLQCVASSYITSLSHLKNLRHLECTFSNFNQNLIDQLDNLQFLSCIQCKNINNVNKFSRTLKELRCDNSGIDQHGISELQVLEKISFGYQQISNLDHLSHTLTSLSCSYTDQKLIENLTNLQDLRLHKNDIINLDHIKNSLTILDLGPSSKIDCKILQNLSNIKSFRCRDLENISDCPFTNNLRELHIHTCKENNNYFKNLNILHISPDYSYGKKISMLPIQNMFDLKILYCSGHHLFDSHIAKLDNMEYLYADNCKDITNIENMTKIKYVSNKYGHIVSNLVDVVH